MPITLEVMRASMGNRAGVGTSREEIVASAVAKIDMRLIAILFDLLKVFLRTV